uniref:Uncharacterized protein n=1 Tax=Rhizophora mucronata TaxID=61149 RepID=A0A2P2PUN6_RHIMU
MSAMILLLLYGRSYVHMYMAFSFLVCNVGNNLV